MAKMPAVGVGIIIQKEDCVLLIKRCNVHGTGTWSTPGGHLDYGEAPEVCAVREAREETGVNVGNVHFIGITNDLFEAEELHFLTIWMVGEYLSGLATVNEEELSEVGWFPRNALPGPLFLPLQNLLDGKSYPDDINPFATGRQNQQ